MAAEEAAEEGEAVAVLLRAASEHGHQDRLGFGAGLGTVAAPDLAVDDGRADGLLRARAIVTDAVAVDVRLGWIEDKRAVVERINDPI